MKTLSFTINAVEIHTEPSACPRRLPTVTLDLQALDRRRLPHLTELLFAVGQQIEIRILEEGIGNLNG